MQVVFGTIANPTNQVGSIPAVALPYDTSVSRSAMARERRTSWTPMLVAIELPPNLLGNYRIHRGHRRWMPARRLRAGSMRRLTTLTASSSLGTGFDMGAYEASVVPPQPPVVTISRSGSMRR